MESSPSKSLMNKQLQEYIEAVFSRSKAVSQQWHGEDRRRCKQQQSRQSVLAVSCPSCNASAGQRCQVLNNGPMVYAHTARYKMAVAAKIK